MWEGEYLQDFQGPGEATRDRQWVRCRNPGCTGDHVPSDLVRFLKGLTLAEVVGPPLEPCCSGHLGGVRVRSYLAFEAGFRLGVRSRPHLKLAFKVHFDRKTIYHRFGSSELAFSVPFFFTRPHDGEEYHLNGYIPEVSTLKLFNLILTDIGDVTIHLFTFVTGGAVNQNTLLGDFVEAAFTGYSAQLAVVETFVPIPLTTNRLTYETLSWIGPDDDSGEDIVGWYATWEDEFAVVHLLFAAEFSFTFSLNSPDDEMTLNVDWQDYDGQHP